MLSYLQPVDYVINDGLVDLKPVRAKLR